ncbi:MAG: hypothetical protein O3C05_03400, partial [Proteobacteria bacterium]|nr:hypothetical protein [Pseudomonadota bacterium]
MFCTSENAEDIKGCIEDIETENIEEFISGTHLNQSALRSEFLKYHEEAENFYNISYTSLPQYFNREWSDFNEGRNNTRNDTNTRIKRDTKISEVQYDNTKKQEEYIIKQYKTRTITLPKDEFLSLDEKYRNRLISRIFRIYRLYLMHYMGNSTDMSLKLYTIIERLKSKIENSSDISEKRTTFLSLSIEILHQYKREFDRGVVPVEFLLHIFTDKRNNYALSKRYTYIYLQDAIKNFKNNIGFRGINHERKRIVTFLDNIDDNKLSQHLIELRRDFRIILSADDNLDIKNIEIILAILQNADIDSTQIAELYSTHFIIQNQNTLSVIRIHDFLNFISNTENRLAFFNQDSDKLTIIKSQSNTKLTVSRQDNLPYKSLLLPNELRSIGLDIANLNKYQQLVILITKSNELLFQSPEFNSQDKKFLDIEDEISSIKSTLPSTTYSKILHEKQSFFSLLYDAEKLNKSFPNKETFFDQEIKNIASTLSCDPEQLQKIKAKFTLIQKTTPPLGLGGFMPPPPLIKYY